MLVLGTTLWAAGGVLSAQNSPVTATSSTVVDSISGHILNAATGQPIPRVLVRCGSQAMLTDYQGQFHCTAGSGTATLVASKPGYYMSEDPAESSSVTLKATPSGEPIDILMYPEAILAGTVTSPAGELLAGVLVESRRSVFDEKGHHWGQPEVSRTDSHGTFRLAVRSGNYCVQSSYLPPNGDRKEAIMPVLFPPQSASEGAQSLHLQSGETLRIELQPDVLPVGMVTVRLEPQSFEGNTRLTAVTSRGASFNLRSTPGDTPGTMKLTVPRGTYTVTARRQMRGGGDFERSEGQSANGFEQAEASLTFGEQHQDELILRYASVNTIPVELVVEPSTGTDRTSPPTLFQLGLTLEAVSSEIFSSSQNSERLATRGDKTAVFNPPPGNYRLRAQSGGSWLIRSATSGTSDLLRQELVVAAGAGTLPIRIVISNLSASLSGTVRRSGQPYQGWVYLVATMPCASPVLIFRTNEDGIYNRASLLPGSYRAIAFEHRHNIDFENAEAIGDISNQMHSVTLNAADKGTLDLEVSPGPGSR